MFLKQWVQVEQAAAVATTPSDLPQRSSKNGLFKNTS